MKKTTELPVSCAVVTTVFVRPTIQATTVCPQCDELNFTEVFEGQQKKSVIHNCHACGKDFLISLPDFTTSK